MSGGEYLGDIPGLTEFLTAFCAIAVFLNLFLIIVLATRMTPCTVIERFIINLSFSDLLLAGICLPVRLNDGSHKGEGFVGGKALVSINSRSKQGGVAFLKIPL